MLLSLREFFIKERVGILKLTDVYDIFDPAENKRIGVIKDEPSALFKYLRLIMAKPSLPTTINIYEDETQAPIFSIQKSFTFIRTKISIVDGKGAAIGYFMSKIFTIGGGFTVCDNAGNQIADVSGDWISWNFTIKSMSSEELGVVTKKWAGIGKELFTTADNYMVSLNQECDNQPALKILLLAAALAIDTVYKENND